MALSILLTCSEEYRLSARDLSLFLWDIVIIHDRLFGYFLNNRIWYSPNFYRRWRRLPPDFELRLGRVSRQSPIEIELIVATAGSLVLAAKTFAEILRMIRDWRYEQEKQKLEILQTKIEILNRIEGLQKASPELLIFLYRDIRRLLGNPIRILEVEVRER